MRRIGLLGGAFNPPHFGHLKLATLALEHLDLEELRIMPAGQSPLKAAPTGISTAQRLALVRAAFAELDPRIRLERLELDQPGPSYTADTLEALSAREPDSAFILILGSDQLALLPRWQRPERILQLASMAMAPRPGAEGALPEGLPCTLVPRWSGAPGEFIWLPGTDLDLASTPLRSKLAGDPADGSLSQALPPEVLAAISRENLYR